MMTQNNLENLTARKFIEKLQGISTSEQAQNYEKSFNNAHNEKFLGVGMGQVFKLAKEFMNMELNEVEQLLESPFHEARVGALSILDFQARNKKTTEEQRKKIFELYIRRHDRINNWDLVDRSAIYAVGGYLSDKPRDILYKLAASKNMWERRTAIVSTAYFMRNKDLDDTFKISEILLHDKEELVQKATGWMLRSAGGERLIEFLDKYATVMPRPTLRNAVEKLDKNQKKYYLGLRKNL